MASKTPLLDRVPTVESLRRLPAQALSEVAAELRAELVDTVASTGGHLGAGLGVVELTLALHYVLDTPTDRLIWDVGHQCYPHKMLTGRRGRMRTLRRAGGLYGFTKRSESPHDPFGAAHSSTAMAAALGMARARDRQGQSHEVVAVVGDGAMSAGLAFEALNNLGAADSRVLVVLNDNGMSIAPAVGALEQHLRAIAAADASLAADAVVAQLARHAGAGAGDRAHGNFFETLGLAYLGPIDGHDLATLVAVLQAVRDSPIAGPILLHVRTEKGRGHPFVEASAEAYHAVEPFAAPGTAPAATADRKGNGRTPPRSAPMPSYSRVFGDTLLELARADERVVAITAAMSSGTGLGTFGEALRERFFDVGIAEQHAVTFAAGLAAEGMRPVVAIYSTFLQRAYDQIVHDVALQSLPVRFAIDRAGLVGADGPTHAGSFDLVYLGCLPGFVVMAPSDALELRHMLRTALAIDDRPSAVRYPRGTGPAAEWQLPAQELPIGRGRVVQEGRQVALLSLGGRLAACREAAARLARRGLRATIADARFAKPLDETLIGQLVADHDVLVTLEEGAGGGFGAQVLACLAARGWLDAGAALRTMTLPDRFVAHAAVDAQYADAGLAAADIEATVLDALATAARARPIFGTASAATAPLGRS